ncbi:MAG: methionine biosynthesis protein MetW [Proteobacteria bacterium]|nr:methionine biosynthesis protein MetW [Pseudomonadota bacterium]MBU1714457.1 methionine biosynthesis protein MetW [Pseudomonadota bacterium]
MRFDLQLIADWIEPGSRVLDLGCGSGDLLFYLKKNKQVAGTGIENDEDKAAQCINKGLSVLQGDINEEVLDYPDNAFDYVILSQTLQQVYEPHKLISNLLKIGKKVIVSFPNFSNWRIRMQIFFTGYAPKSRQLPYEWYDTPNIRVITIKDFRRFVKKTGCRIINEVAINTHSHDRQGKIISFLSNLRATYGIFLIEKKDH